MGCGNSKSQEKGTHAPKKKESDHPNEVSMNENKPIIIFIAGGPGSGKGTQCAKIVHDYGFHHISTGDILRNEVKKEGPDSEELKSIMNSGKLVPSSLLVKLIKKTITEMNKKNDVFLLDGFPRNIENVEEWEKQLKDFADIKVLLNFECSNETMMSRIMERSKHESREDDNPETIKKRLEVFHKETEPVLGKFKEENKIASVSVESDPNSIYEEVMKVLNGLGLSKLFSGDKKDEAH